MNYNQCFESSGSCIADHMNLAMLAEPRLAVTMGPASASNIPFSPNYRSKGTNRDPGRLLSSYLSWKQTEVSSNYQYQKSHNSFGQSLPPFHCTKGFS